MDKTFNVGYPVYGAGFFDESRLAVAGGGGEGNHGVANKVSIIEIAKEDAEVAHEYEFDAHDDSPTALAASGSTLVVACNESSSRIKSGKGNRNLRLFSCDETSKLKVQGAVDLDHSREPDDYIRTIRISRDGRLLATAASTTDNLDVVRVVCIPELEERFEIDAKEEVRDLQLSPDGKLLAYVTSSALEVISTVTGKSIARKPHFDSNWILTKLAFLGNDEVLIAAAWQRGRGIVFTRVRIRGPDETPSTIKTRLVSRKYKSVTAMDVSRDSQLIVLATSDNTILFYSLPQFHLVKVMENAHQFAITSVAFSPDRNFAVSVSAANTVRVTRIPQDIASHSIMMETLYKILKIVVIILIAIAFQHIFRPQGLLHTKFIDAVESITGNADSDSRSLQDDIFQQITLVGPEA